MVKCARDEAAVDRLGRSSRSCYSAVYVAFQDHFFRSGRVRDSLVGLSISGDGLELRIDTELARALPDPERATTNN